MKIIVSITGASGSEIAVRFLKNCNEEKYLIISKWGLNVLFQETGLTAKDLTPYCREIFSNEDLNSIFASGATYFDAMIILPCSTNTLSKIANGISDNLITRVGSICLKERRKLILCLRETPLSGIILENALKLVNAGAIFMPVSPLFYLKPKTIEELIDDFVQKILSEIGLPNTLSWKEKNF